MGLNYFKGTVKILSIDGGGIRGYIPALILREVEERLQSRGVKKPLGALFDFLAGTSTGSIISLGLAAPRQLTNTAYSKNEAAFSAEEIADMYLDHGLDIFPRRIFTRFQTMRHAFREKYSDGRFQEILEESFGRRTIKDSITNVLVTSFDIDKNEPLIMKKVPPRLRKEDPPNYYMSDAIRASSSAPTYFEPIQVSSVDNTLHHSLIDGGVFANNPAMCAFVEAQKIFPWAKKYIILSLGTGNFPRRWTYEQIKDWGVIEWIQPSKGVPIAIVMNQGQSQTVNYQLSHLPRVEYHRINPVIDKCSSAMDDAAKENMTCLRESAEEAITRNEGVIERIVRMLE